MTFLAILLAATVQAADPIEMGKIEARLFYKGSGRLSDDLLGRSEPFTFHNTIIAEGDAEEAADDLMISVRFMAGRFETPEKKHRFVEKPVEIVARDAQGKTLGRRVFPSVLTDHNGFERKVLWLNDVTCSGKVIITATYGDQRRSAQLTMGCGE